MLQPGRCRRTGVLGLIVSEVSVHGGRAEPEQLDLEAESLLELQAVKQREGIRSGVSILNSQSLPPVTYFLYKVTPPTLHK